MRYLNARITSAGPAPGPSFGAKCRNSFSSAQRLNASSSAWREPLPRPPHKRGANREIPYRADQRAAEAGDPPAAVVIVDPGCDTDIRYRPDGTDHLKADKAGQKGPAGEPLVAISKKVVEHEIPCRSDDGSDRLRC